MSALIFVTILPYVISVDSYTCGPENKCLCSLQHIACNKARLTDFRINIPLDKTE